MADARAALEALGRLPDEELDVADAALQLARAEQPGADWRAARAHLSDLARAAAALPGGSLAERAADLAELLAGRFGFRGDVETYDDLANANLIRVLERRRGLPVALGILWLHAAHAAGWDAYGLDVPSHFLVGLGGGDRQLVVDPFVGGRMLDAAALAALAHQVAGPGVALGSALLRPVSDRLVLLRLQNNVKLRLLGAGDIDGALACTERMLLLAPEAATLWREAAALRSRQGDIAGAVSAWQRFLALVPEGALADMARDAVVTLRARLH